MKWGAPSPDGHWALGHARIYVPFLALAALLFPFGVLLATGSGLAVGAPAYRPANGTLYVSDNKLGSTQASLQNHDAKFPRPHSLSMARPLLLTPPAPTYTATSIRTLPYPYLVHTYIYLNPLSCLPTPALRFFFFALFFLSLSLQVPHLASPHLYPVVAIRTNQPRDRPHISSFSFSLFSLLPLPHKSYYLHHTPSSKHSRIQGFFSFLFLFLVRPASVPSNSSRLHTSCFM